MDTIRVEAVSGAGAGWYRDYRCLRHRVFVAEQGWGGVSPRGARGPPAPDPADADAWFWLAWSGAGQLAGAVRVRPVRDVFPHEDLFRDHLERPELAAVRSGLGTLNSLVVAGDWRQRRCVATGPVPRTVAAHLLSAAVAGSLTHGLCAIVATAQTSISARALMRAGFRVIDRPVRTSLHSVFPMCNLGLGLGDGDASRAVTAYFARREHEVLAGRSITWLFSRA
jgi:hypothetical protein